jgi:hypothetical protein
VAALPRQRQRFGLIERLFVVSFRCVDFIMSIARNRFGLAIAVVAVSVGQSIAFASRAHAGFFDFLFGPPPQTRAIEPYYPYPSHFRRHADRGFHRHAAHRLVARVKLSAADKHPVQPLGPIDIMDDDSLKHGDAVMTQAGIRIFVGYSSSHHEPEDFRRISDIKKLSRRERSALAALDTQGLNSGEQKRAEAGIVTGRSATERKITVGETITDSNGRTIRYVGP